MTKTPSLAVLTHPPVLSDFILGQRHVDYIAEDLDLAPARFHKLFGLAESQIRIEPRVDWLRRALVTAPSGSGGIVTFSNRRLVYLDTAKTGGLLVELVRDMG